MADVLARLTHGGRISFVFSIPTPNDTGVHVRTFFTTTEWLLAGLSPLLAIVLGDKTSITLYAFKKSNDEITCFYGVLVTQGSFLWYDKKIQQSLKTIFNTLSVTVRGTAGVNVDFNTLTSKSAMCTGYASECTLSEAKLSSMLHSLP